MRVELHIYPDGTGQYVFIWPGYVYSDYVNEDQVHGILEQQVPDGATPLNYNDEFDTYVIASPEAQRVGQ